MFLMYDLTYNRDKHSHNVYYLSGSIHILYTWHQLTFAA